ncbi:MAG TPA: cupredoxin family copper-binding protein [Candidatus Baltobacteraceae bacterium]
MLTRQRPQILFLCAALIFSVRALAHAQTAPTPAPSPTPSRTPVAIVHTKDFAYDPKDLKIAVGDTVEFINDDEVAHTVTSDNAFDSGDLEQHQHWTHIFTKAGTYTYYCTYHPFMKADIVVSAP